MITVVHGGQTGVDRGTHEAAIDNAWKLAGHMPRDQRDELGPIPPEVAKFLVAIDATSYAARTAANVRASTATLIVVRDKGHPRETPGTTRTLELATARRMRHLIVDPASDPETIARWIWADPHRMTRTLTLPFLDLPLDPPPMRLLVGGPRESKWSGAQAQTAALLRKVASALTAIVQPCEQRPNSSRTQR